MNEIVAVDLGGTHARFAIARIEGRRVVALAQECTLKAAEHAGFEEAWAAFAARAGRPLPRAASIGLAGPTDGDELKLTNNDWVIRPADFRSLLSIDQYRLVNDFAAVAHAVAQLGPGHFRHLAGPGRPLPAEGIISIVGPGTGLGVAQLVRRGGRDHVVATEGGHVGFAPLDPFEDRLLARLRERFGRVSAERVVSGAGLSGIYKTLADIEQSEARILDDVELWDAALSSRNPLAAAALERFCLSLGAVAGDIALAQGADAVVIAGGLGLRLADHLSRSGFGDRFVAKGRFEGRLAAMPVKLITCPQPGLFGAAAAYAADFGD